MAIRCVMLFIAFGMLYFSPIETKAQVVPDPVAYDIKAGGGLVYGTEIENLGLQLNGYYRLPANDQIFVGGDFTYYFPDKSTFFGAEIRTTWIEFNINGQYHFFDDDQFGAYGLGGLNYTSLRFSTEFNGFEESDSESEIGLNIGGGVEYELDFGLIYGELKFVISDADQLVIGAGVRIPIAN